MSIIYTYLCVAAAIVAALIADSRAYRRALEAEPSVVGDESAVSSQCRDDDSSGEHLEPLEDFQKLDRLDNKEPAIDAVLMLSPFLVFFYPQAFWLNFSGFMALWALGCCAVYGLNRFGFLDHSLELQKLMGPGIALLVGIGYLIFLHQGPLASTVESSVTELTTADAPLLERVVTLFPAWLWWAYGLFISVSVLMARHKDGTMLAALLLLLGLAILPFYTGYYWWSLGAGVIVFLLALKPLLYAMDETSKGGIAFVLVFLAQMIFVGSIVVYAIFF
ncbi:hypothetical protein R50072_08200 [Simiduia litorea]|uniref:hypothetical protein n=1 Tax=Simiduia litorea TaxID=1435348 RepID=UPI0036F3D58F